MSDNVLKVSGLKVAYGGIKAVKGIDLEVNKGELVALIGANGAGKTTTLKAITGTLPACKVEGTVSYKGASLKGSQSFHLVEKKLAMVPEGRGVFTRMSIHENLMMGAYTRNDQAGIDAGLIVAGVGAHHQVFMDAHAGKHAAPFRHHRQLFLHQMEGLAAFERGALVADRAFHLAGGQRTGDGFQGGGLAGTIGTDQRYQLALVDFQINAFDRLDTTVRDFQSRYFKNIVAH